MEFLAAIILIAAAIPLFLIAFLTFFSLFQLLIDMFLLGCSLIAIILAGAYEFGHYVVNGEHYNPGAGSEGKTDASDA